MCLNQLKLQFSVVKSTYVVVSPTVHGFNFHFSWVKPFSYPFWGSHRPNVSQKRNSAFLTRTPRRFCSFCTMRCNSTCETKREITCVHCVHLYTDLHVVYIYMWLSTVYLYIYMYMYICVGITRRVPEQSRTPSWRYLIQDQGSRHSGIIPSGDSPTRWKIWKNRNLTKTHLSPSGMYFFL